MNEEQRETRSLRLPGAFISGGILIRAGKTFKFCARQAVGQSTDVVFVLKAEENCQVGATERQIS